MPVDLMLVVASVVLMFVVFAGALAWGDLQTRPTKSAQESNVKHRAF